MKRLFKNLIIILSIVLLTVAAVEARTNKYAGKNSALFLDIPVDARGAAMGEASVAITEDVSALWWNPAGLGCVKTPQLLFMHNEYIQDLRQEYGAVAIPIKGKIPGVVGFSINYLDYGKLDRITITSGNAGTTTGNFDMNAWAATLAYSNRYNKDLSLGVSVKYIQDKLDTIKGTAWAVDGGLKYWVRSNLALGYSFSNLGSKIKYENESSDLPLTHRIGLGWHALNNKFTAVLDAVYTNRMGWSYNAGGEYWIIPKFAVRGGYLTGRDTKDKYTVGAGFVHKNISLDYSYSPFSDFGSSHKASINISFGN